MKIYPVLSSDVYALSCVPVSMLDRIGDDELRTHLSAGGSLKFLVAQDTFGRVQTDTGYVSKHIEYADLSTVLADDFELQNIQNGINQLPDFVRKNDLQNVSVVIDSLPRPYIVSAFQLSNGYITELSGYPLSSALTALVPGFNYTVLSASAVYTQKLNAPEIDSISALLPSAATPENRLADKEYVSAETKLNASYFRGAFDSWAAVPDEFSSYLSNAYGDTTPTRNDYMIVRDVTDYSAGGGTWPDWILDGEKEGVWLFGYVSEWGESGKAGWRPHYRVERYNFSKKQLDAIDSGVTSGNFVMRQSSSSTGSEYKGVWLDSDGGLNTMRYELRQNVSDSARLTDHIYIAAPSCGIQITNPTGSEDPYKISLLSATTSSIGGVIVGAGLDVVNGTVQASTAVRVFSYADWQALPSPEDISASAFGTDVHPGSILIMRRGFRLNDSSQYTGYVYTGTRWEAMGGNYSSDNVVFPEDIPFAGEWTQVGNIVHNEEDAMLSALHCGGKTVTETFKMIFGSAPQKKIIHAPAGYSTVFQYTGEYRGPFEDAPDELDPCIVESGTGRAIVIGEYTYTLSLPDTENYVWSTGGTSPIVIEWSIV